jgi:hypothetical protein
MNTGTARGCLPTFGKKHSRILERGSVLLDIHATEHD